MPDPHGPPPGLRRALAPAAAAVVEPEPMLLGGREAVLIEDLDGAVLDLDETAERLYGWTRAQLVGQSSERLVPPEWQARAQQDRRACRAGETIHDAGVRWTKDGRRIAVVLTLSPLRDPAGQIVAVATAALDLGRLDERERIRQEIETHVGVVFWLNDLYSHRFLYVSRSYDAMWGRSHEQLAVDPLGWLDAILPADQRRAEALYAGLRDGVPAEIEFRMVRPDGELRWVRASATPLADASGRFTRSTGVAQDVTEEVQMREALAQARSAAARAEEREREILASDLHDSVGQLLPLARIKLDALRDDPKLLSAAHELGELRSLLAEAEQQIRTLTFRLGPPPSEDGGLEQALERLARALRAQYGLDVTVRADAREPLVDAERAALLARGVREALINVSRHARTDRAEVRIRREDAWLVVSVRDQGKGFDPATAQASRGFGLRALRSRLEAIGGFLEVESAPGRGTRVRLGIPAPPDALL